MKLIDLRTPDGSRHFASLPLAASWAMLCEHVQRLSGAKLLNFVSGGLAKAWLDFHFQEHRFLLTTHKDGVRLIVHDPQCPDLVLYEVGRHFERLLEGEAA